MHSTQGKLNDGFTLVELMISTVLFAIVLSSMLILFNYALKINRKTESIRQATQGVRNFAEFAIKEIRNGRIDYTTPAIVSQCTIPYGPTSTAVALRTLEGDRICLFMEGGQLKLAKNSLPVQIITPSRLTVDMASYHFYVRPTCDPYTTCAGGVYPAQQPVVVMALKFVLTLPTGEVVTLPYQTSVTTTVYDIPRN
jgi:prepilin-type N-terminal cleavage/methylation domain-containing protein